MSKFKANAFGLATSLSKALESVGSKNNNNVKDTNNLGGHQGLLNNNPSNDHSNQSNYNYSPLTRNDNDDGAGSSSANYSPLSRYSKKFDADYTPKCMRPKSLSFQEEDQNHKSGPVSPPLLTSSTNPFLPAGSKFSTRPFIYNDLKGHTNNYSQPSNGEWEMCQELKEIKSNKRGEFLETNFETEPVEEVKANYKLNLGIPMVGMVPNAELVKINTQHPTSPATPSHAVAAIHPSQAVPLSSIFGLPAAMPSQKPPKPEIVQSVVSPPTESLILPINPNSKSTDIF